MKYLSKEMGLTEDYANQDLYLLFILYSALTGSKMFITFFEQDPGRGNNPTYN